MALYAPYVYRLYIIEWIIFLRNSMWIAFRSVFQLNFEKYLSSNTTSLDMFGTWFEVKYVCWIKITLEQLKLTIFRTHTKNGMNVIKNAPMLTIKWIPEILRAENANFTLISVELQVDNIAYDQKLIHFNKPNNVQNSNLSSMVKLHRNWIWFNDRKKKQQNLLKEQIYNWMHVLHCSCLVALLAAIDWDCKNKQWCWYGADVRCCCQCKLLPFNSSTYIRKTSKCQRGKYMIPNRRASFTSYFPFG